MIPFLTQHAWIAVVVLVTGGLVRLTKADNRFPIVIPPRLRAILAFVLGIAGAVLHKLIAGGDVSVQGWLVAVADGLTAGGGAVVGHEIVIESILDGKEIPVPGLMKTFRRGKPLSDDELKHLVALELQQKAEDASRRS